MAGHWSTPQGTAAAAREVERLREYLSGVAGQAVAADDDVFELGLINSLRALEIVMHVEQTYGIEVTVEDLDLSNFRTATRLAEFVRTKRTLSAREP